MNRKKVEHRVGCFLDVICGQKNREILEQKKAAGKTSRFFIEVPES